MFTLIFIGWGIGITGYVVLNKMNKYNNRNFYDVKSQVKKYKRIRDNVNGVEKKTFK
jgi:hypothetical protein